MEHPSLPIIDLARASAPDAVSEACRAIGFFYVVGHGVDEALPARLEAMSRTFFARTSSEKKIIGMKRVDPGWDAEVHPIAAAGAGGDDADGRWDHASVHDFRGTYGEYLINKVSKVFPELRRDVL